MFSNNGKISDKQMKALIFSDFVGIYLIYLPIIMFTGDIEGVFSGMLLSFVVGSAAIFIISYFIEKKNFNLKKDLFFKLLCVLFFIKTAIMGGYFINLSSFIISDVFVRGTSKWAAAALILISGIFLCSRGLETRGRFGEICAFFIILGSIYVFIITSFDCDFREIKRTFILNKESFKVFKGVIFSFMGIENIIFLLPLVSATKNKKAGIEGAKSFIFLGLFVFALTGLALCRYGKYEISSKLWPVLQMMNSADFPGMLLERQDIIIMGIWLMSIVSFAGYTLSFMILQSNEFLGRKSKKTVLISSIILFVISLYGQRGAKILEGIWNLSFLNIAAAILAFIYVLYNYLGVEK